MTYRFVQGIDYGTRKGTEGFAIHMAEGGDGTVAYLARRAGESDAEWKVRVRGVSANFVVLSTGEVVQMVGWGKASGSMNPRDRGPMTGFYNTGVIQAVLGSHYTDPNAYSLSVEITGFRKDGPNAKQVAATIALVTDARGRYPKMVGAYGHHDQTSTKVCPGLAPGMRAIWNAVGHGPFLPDTSTGTEAHDVAINTRGLTLVSHHAVTLPDDTRVYEFAEAGAPLIGTFSGTVPYFGLSNGYKAVRVSGPDGSVIGYTSTAATVWANPPDEDAVYNAGVTAASKKALEAKR